MPSPLAPSTPEKIACHCCDALYDFPPIGHGQRLRCSRCSSILMEFSDTAIQRALALSIAGLILLLSTFFFPMIEINVQGQTSSINLLDSALMLFENNNLLLGGLVMVLILIIPFFSLTAVILLAIFMLARWQSRQWVFLARWFYRVRDWNMVEVYLIGMVVSLSNLMSMANVSLGLAFWALMAFSLTFLAAVYNMDRHLVWNRIRELLH